jgi:epoxyqueuosine reductase
LNLIQSNIKKLIEAKAVELGFVKTGFAKAEVLYNESLHLKLWLGKDYDADMKWISKGFDKRKDVRLIMENAKTVISLAYNYYTPFKHDENLPKISRYAWGKDYHKILKKKLKELTQYIENITPLNPPFIKGGKERSSGGFKAMTVSYVDDGPVMDKAWAVRSGVGWMGKHTNIINPDYGSWLFLCEIITNLEFDTYDSPIEDLCGSCRICIDACPTGAIVDEYVLDANLCISYQTIENRGEIPDYINLDGWIFGCDVCQDVCPFNKNDKVTNDKSFYPTLLNSPFKKGEEMLPDKGSSEGGFRTKAELEAITEEEFKTIFSDSPIKRTKFKGWRRNLGRI